MGVTNELKPCPFCGSKNVFLREGVMFAGAIHCDNCSADVVFNAVENFIDRETELSWKDRTIKSWNERIEADNKQAPKKPTYEGDGYDDNGNLIYDTWICPNCETKYEVDCDDYKHCPECGQALDWSDIE